MYSSRIVHCPRTWSTWL